MKRTHEKITIRSNTSPPIFKHLIRRNLEEVKGHVTEVRGNTDNKTLRDTLQASAERIYENLPDEAELMLRVDFGGYLLPLFNSLFSRREYEEVIILSHINALPIGSKKSSLFLPAVPVKPYAIQCRGNSKNYELRQFLEQEAEGLYKALNLEHQSKSSPKLPVSLTLRAVLTG